VSISVDGVFLNDEVEFNIPLHIKEITIGKVRPEIIKVILRRR